MGDPHPLTEEKSATKVDQLQRAIASARRAGIRIRREWLAGQTGGGCEIAGARWLFLDLSLPIQEQIGQVEDALRLWKAPASSSSASSSTIPISSPAQFPAQPIRPHDTSLHTSSFPPHNR